MEHARHYITGLMGTQRSKNIETIGNDVAGSDSQGMEQFISSSPWHHRTLLDDVARDADEAIGDDEEAGRKTSMDAARRGFPRISVSISRNGVWHSTSSNGRERRSQIQPDEPSS